jgi:glyoxylase-like metal-dependent hydrolase (beta-lactamase superfamily II)
MGISDKVTAELTRLPIVVLNSHTHNDHVGDNWQFETIYGMDTDFTRKNAQGSREDAQAELAPDQICGQLPKGFDPKTYTTPPWKITAYKHDGDRIDLGGRWLEVIATPGHTPDAISLLDRANGLLFTGDTYYPGPIWLYRPETNLSLRCLDPATCRSDAAD